MGNSGSANGQHHRYLKREESFGSPQVRHSSVNNVDMSAKSSYFGSSDRVIHPHRTDSFQKDHHQQIPSQQRHNRSQSLEQNGGAHSPSSSSSSNSYMGADRNCLRQSAQPKFQISGDLNPQQIQLVKRTWKQVLKSIDGDEMEIAIRLLLRIFQLDPRNLGLFDLPDLPPNELRHNPIFLRHVKAFEPTLVHVMEHPSNATSLSKYLQQLGGRHVQNTGVTYKSGYWKTFVQALIEVVGAEKASADTFDAFTVLGAFCVEQMRIGYKIEYKLQREAEKIARIQIHKRSSQHSRK